jgi:hypothetical protein
MWEVSEYKKSNVNVFPDDVRKDLDMFKDTMIAWPGIIKTHQLKKYDDKVDVELVLEHHYYDWLEDYGLQKEKIFLSPQGKGVFTTIWPLRSDVDLEEWDRMVNDGDLTIVYGYPDSILIDSTIVIKSTYIRSFPKDFYRTDMLDYGRIYEPAERKYLKPRMKRNNGEMCCIGCLSIGFLGALGSLSYLSFGDEILGGLAIPLALGLGALSYYNFTYGDERTDTEVFFVNTLSPIGISIVAVLSSVVFPSHVFKMSEKFSLQAQQNGMKISVKF